MSIEKLLGIKAVLMQVRALNFSCTLHFLRRLASASKQGRETSMGITRAIMRSLKRDVRVLPGFLYECGWDLAWEYPLQLVNKMPQ